MLKPIKSILYKRLAQRDYSRKMIAHKLTQMGYPEIEIEEALNEAEKQGFLNDQRFTENYVYYRSRCGHGPRRIEAELIEKGIDRAIIAASMPDKTHWQTLAEQVREKRFGKSLPKSYAEKCKQMRFLQGRGFGVEGVLED
jgi:regulatory protein